MDDQMFKFFDWYYSTGRSWSQISIAFSLEEALQMEPTVLPDLETMKKQLKDAVPYDLWLK